MLINFAGSPTFLCEQPAPLVPIHLDEALDLTCDLMNGTSERPMLVVRGWFDCIDYGFLENAFMWDDKLKFVLRFHGKTWTFTGVVTGLDRPASRYRFFRRRVVLRIRPTGEQELV